MAGRLVRGLDGVTPLRVVVLVDVRVRCECGWTKAARLQRLGQTGSALKELGAMYQEHLDKRHGG